MKNSLVSIAAGIIATTHAISLETNAVPDFLSGILFSMSGGEKDL